MQPSVEVVAELQKANSKFAYPNRASGAVLLASNVPANRLKFFESFSMGLLLVVAKLAEVTLFLLQDSLEAFAVKDHGLHGNI